MVDVIANTLRRCGVENIQLMDDHTSAPDSFAKQLLESALHNQLLDSNLGELATDVDLAMLYTLNRSYLSADIEALLEDGWWVICDRWYYSTIAYQATHAGGGGNCVLNPDQVLALQYDLDIIEPDLVIHLDVDSESAYDRGKIRGQRTVPHGRTHLDVRRAYLWCMREALDQGVEWAYLNTSHYPVDFNAGSLASFLTQWYSGSLVPVSPDSHLSAVEAAGRSLDSDPCVNNQPSRPAA